jgi:predicted nucleic acid-binding protein
VRFLVDTNVISELRKPRADPRVAAWMRSQETAELATSVIAIMELEIGVALVERRDADQGAILRAWLEHRVLTGFRDRFLPVDLTVARRAASLHVPGRDPERDTLIAATALVHHLTVVTRNTDDFQTTGVRLINPWA